MTLNLGPAATVEKATVAGSDNKVNGTGDLLDCTIPEGSTASVEVMGAFVVGNNTYQPLVTEPYEFPTPEVVVPGVEVVSNVALTAMQPEAVTVAGNKATITDTYKTAFYTVPQELQDNLKAVKVTASSDGQFCIKVLDDQGNILNDLSGYGGDMPNYGVSAMTQYTASYPVSAKVVQIEFMSLGDLPLEVVVEKLEFVLNTTSGDAGDTLPDTVEVDLSGFSKFYGGVTVSQEGDLKVAEFDGTGYAGAGLVLGTPVSASDYPYVKAYGDFGSNWAFGFKVMYVGEVVENGNCTVLKYGYNGEVMDLSAIAGESVEKFEFSTDKVDTLKVEKIVFAKSADLLP